jgi:HNH endonuclease
MKLPFCVACLAKEDLQHHHLVTRAEGGKDNDANLITLCTACHDKLHDRQTKGTYNHSKNIKAGLRRAVAEGKQLGRPRIESRARGADQESSERTWQSRRARARQAIRGGCEHSVEGRPRPFSRRGRQRRLKRANPVAAALGPPRPDFLTIPSRATPRCQRKDSSLATPRSEKGG